VSRRLAGRVVAVLLGGPSAEHDVSLVSGRAIAAGLAEAGHEPQGWLIDLDGRWWHLTPAAMDRAIPASAYDDPASLGADGPFGPAAALERLAAEVPQPVVFPALHGPYGEDGTLQAMLESVGLAYCGSGPAASAIGMDKAIFKRLCGALGVPVVPWIAVHAADFEPRDRAATLKRVQSFAAGLPDPRLVIKPARMGSSIGVGIVGCPGVPPELEHAMAEAFRHDDLLLAEAYVAGARELEASVIGNDPAGIEVFGPGEVIPGREFYDFVAKYRSDASRTLTSPEPPLDPGLRDRARSHARDVYLAIGAAGFARVDFLLARDGRLFVSEINTIPGFTPISLFPVLCAEGGYGFPGVCDRIVELAVQHAGVRARRRLTRADLP
jgi:D-alanine-D-alanine ligase